MLRQERMLFDPKGTVTWRSVNMSGILGCLYIVLFALQSVAPYSRSVMRLQRFLHGILY